MKILWSALLYTATIIKHLHSVVGYEEAEQPLHTTTSRHYIQVQREPSVR